jgi:hypothetical protein
MLTALPVWQAAMHAQNTFVSLLILTTTATFWRSKKPLAAGLTAGLLLFKPQLAVVLAVVLVASQGRRALLGFAITAAALLAVTVGFLPGSLAEYFHQLPINLRAIQILPNYTWHRHVTFLAWWRILLQGHTGALPTDATRWLAMFCVAGVGVAMLPALRRREKNTDRLIAAAIVAAPMLMPYYMDYDLSLLAVAAVLCAADALRNGLDRSVCVAWTAFYAVMELNPPIAGATRLIPDVPLLAILSIVLIRKARQPVAAIALPPHNDQTLAIAA